MDSSRKQFSGEFRRAMSCAVATGVCAALAGDVMPGPGGDRADPEVCEVLGRLVADLTDAVLEGLPQGSQFSDDEEGV